MAILYPARRMKEFKPNATVCALPPLIRMPRILVPIMFSDILQSQLQLVIPLLARIVSRVDLFPKEALQPGSPLVRARRVTPTPSLVAEPFVSNRSSRTCPRSSGCLTA